ncbi:hypothetical protein [Lysinibacillus sp. OTC-L20]|uniref:hypothetical protein n=1 Tax=Lysinibacillus sp. OTC-L20 TaxID=3342791 RepID=UPI0035BB84E4
MTWEEVLKDIEIQPNLLQKFRTGVANSLRIFLFEIDETMEYIAHEQGSTEADEYERDQKYFRCEAILELFNEVGIDVNTLKVTPISEMGYGYYANCFELSELYDLLNKKDDFQFFSAMSYLTQMEFGEFEQGLQRLQTIVKTELKRCNIKIPPYRNTVFIAMSFDETLVKVREAIMAALTSQGFQPVIIDSKEHNNQIVPEIFSEIDKAKFVIADLTNQRTGVYYEAGYAKGKNKEVILTCRKDDLSNMHFDVAQTNTILWETEVDLKTRLTKRIEAMTLLSV